MAPNKVAIVVVDLTLGNTRHGQISPSIRWQASCRTIGWGQGRRSRQGAALSTSDRPATLQHGIEGRCPYRGCTRTLPESLEMRGNRCQSGNNSVDSTVLMGPLHATFKENAMPRKDKARFPARLKPANDDRVTLVQSGETAADRLCSDLDLIPLVRLLARQAAAEMFREAANDNHPSREERR